MAKLIGEAIERKKSSFTGEEKKRIDQLLLEAVESFDRGEYAPVLPDEFTDLAKRRIDRHEGKQNLAGARAPTPTQPRKI